jgi:hypothetical protein
MIEGFRKRFLRAPVFVSRAYAGLEALDADQYRMRSVEGAKELIEEIMPLAAFLKHLEIPDRRVRCRYAGGDGPHDARLRLAGPEVERGFLAAAYFVEVTTAVAPTDYLEREALTRYVGFFGGGDIRRVGSGKGAPIVSKPLAVDAETPVLRAIGWVTDRLKAKASKTYPRPCILVVNIELERPFGIGEWARLAEAVRPSVDRTRFDLAYIVNWQSNTVFEI